MAINQTVNAQSGERKKSCEVRLGLIMYGGVSLAIYINGVAQEFFRAVRGRGVFKLIKALTDSDIVVDIVSGTSAGGINGIMLAYALCNEMEFSASSTLWRQHGDIRSLLRSPGDAEQRTSSLLNSEGYYQPRLEDAFRFMPRYVREVGEMNSEFSELDLFVTGTDVDGNIYTQFDDAGHPIDVKDHRSVFQLKHRRGRKEPFAPRPSYATSVKEEAVYRSLAKLSRITSCFPAAFAPVFVPKSGDEADQNLVTWGKLNKDSVFLDGGVIDNKPFTYTLKEIFYRAADRRVNRKLFYVEPDPEQFSEPDTATQPNVLQAIIASLIGIPGYESISDDLKLLAAHNTKIAQYKRFTKSLSRQKPVEALHAHTEELYLNSRVSSLCDRLVKGILKVDGQEELLSPELRQAGTALLKAFDTLMDDPDALGAQSPGMKQGGRPADVEKRTEFFRRNLDQFDIYFRLRRLSRLVYLINNLLYAAPEEKELPVTVDDDTEKAYLELWRAFNRQIELLDIIRVAMENLLDDLPIDWKAKIKGKLDEYQEIVDETRDISLLVKRAMGKLLDENEALRKLVPTKYVKPEPGQKWISQQLLSEINSLLKESAKKIINEVRSAVELKEKTAFTAPVATAAAPHAPAAKRKSLFDITYECEEDMLRQILKIDNLESSEDPICRAYETFEQLDAQVFPLEMIGGLGEKDIIETIRISPRDAKKGFSDKGLSDKVSGDALYHFGGFFKRSWRSNDILWGRLDCLCQLIETLLNRERIKSLLRNAANRQVVKGYFFSNDPQTTSDSAEWRPGMEPARLFPHAGKATQESCEKWLISLLVGTEEERRAALGEKFDEMLTLIIEAAQLEVINEELPNVINDALGEQAQWNQFRLTKTEIEEVLESQSHARAASRQSSGEDEKIDPFAFKPAGGKLDPLTAIIAAAGRSHEVMEHFADKADDTPENPLKTRLGKFFINQYQVGTEELLKDMPKLVLLEILAVSLLVLRNCLLEVFRQNAEKVKKSSLYVFGLDYPLRIFHAVVVFLRRAPENTWNALKVGAFVISLFALMTGVLWWQSIIYPGKQFQSSWFIVFIGAPLTIITALGVHVWQQKFSDSWTGRLVSAAFKLAVALLILLPLFFMLAVLGEFASDIYRSLAARSEWLAVLSLSLTLPMIFLVYMVFLKWLSRHAGRRPATIEELKQTLVNSFSFEELDRLADRLMSSHQIDWGRAREVLHDSIQEGESARMLTNSLEAVKVFRRVEAEELLQKYFSPPKMKLLVRRCQDEKVIERVNLARLIKHYFNLEDVREIVRKRVLLAGARDWQKSLKILSDYFEGAEIERITAHLTASGLIESIPTGSFRRESEEKAYRITLGSWLSRLIGREQVVVQLADGVLEAIQPELRDAEQGASIERKLWRGLEPHAQIRWASLRNVVREKMGAKELAQIILRKIQASSLELNFTELEPVLEKHFEEQEITKLRYAVRGFGKHNLDDWQRKLESLSVLKQLIKTKPAQSHSDAGETGVADFVPTMLRDYESKESFNYDALEGTLKEYVGAAEMERISRALKTGEQLTIREWQQKLESVEVLDGFVWSEELLKKLGAQLKVPLRLEDVSPEEQGKSLPSIRQRKEKMAYRMIEWAQTSTTHTRQLEWQMRALNPEAMYYL